MELKSAWTIILSVTLLCSLSTTSNAAVWNKLHAFASPVRAESPKVMWRLHAGRCDRELAISLLEKTTSLLTLSPSTYPDHFFSSVSEAESQGANRSRMLLLAEGSHPLHNYVSRGWEPATWLTSVGT